MRTGILLDDLQKDIESDLDWRQAELAIFREILTSSTRHSIRTSAIFRAAWALLYAHYEGFVKYCLELYLEFISKTLDDCHGVPDRMFVFLIEKQIKEAKSLSPEALFAFFQTTVHSLRACAPVGIAIDTRANLWPELLNDILCKLDLQTYNVIADERKLRTLVARRNDIAHGKRVFIDKIDYYLDYECAVTNLMYGLALAVVDKCERHQTSSS